MYIDGSEDIIDSRDIVARIEELVAEFDEVTETDSSETIMSVDDWKVGLTAEDAEELVQLIDFRDEWDGSFGDSFEDGVAFIRDSYFVEFTQELAEDWGAVDENADWVVIDWQATAENIRQDYTEVEFDGATYWAR